MKKLINEIVNRNKKFKNKFAEYGFSLEIQGQFSEEFEDDESETFELEIQLGDLRSTIAEMEVRNKQLKKEVEEHKTNIKLLRECINKKIDAAETNNASVKRVLILEKLKKKKNGGEIEVLKIIKKLDDVEQ